MPVNITFIQYGDRTIGFLNLARSLRGNAAYKQLLAIVSMCMATQAPDSKRADYMKAAGIADLNKKVAR